MFRILYIFIAVTFCVNRAGAQDYLYDVLRSKRSVYDAMAGNLNPYQDSVYVINLAERTCNQVLFSQPYSRDEFHFITGKKKITVYDNNPDLATWGTIGVLKSFIGNSRSSLNHAKRCGVPMMGMYDVEKIRNGFWSINARVAGCTMEKLYSDCRRVCVSGHKYPAGAELYFMIDGFEAANNLIKSLKKSGHWRGAECQHK